MKTNVGRFFEDYSIGQVIEHACPRSLGTGERALYHALYPSRHALYSSDTFAQSCGFKTSPVDDLIVFHIVFGKSVPDISINAVANLGYAEARWLAPVYPGDTLRSVSTIIGLKQNSNGKTGIAALCSYAASIIRSISFSLQNGRAPSCTKTNPGTSSSCIISNKAL